MLARKGTVKQMTSYFKTPGANLNTKDKQSFEELKTTIEACTNEFLPEADLAKNREIVETLKAEGSAKVLSQVVFLLRKKLGQGSKYIKSISYTLSLLECMVTHGGIRLQASLGTSAWFMTELERIAKKYAAKPQPEFEEVANYALELIQAWGVIFEKLEKNPCPEFVNTFYRMKMDSSIHFPTTVNYSRGPSTHGPSTHEDHAFLQEFHSAHSETTAAAGSAAPAPGAAPANGVGGNVPPPPINTAYAVPGASPPVPGFSPPPGQVPGYGAPMIPGYVAPPYSPTYGGPLIPDNFTAAFEQVASREQPLILDQKTILEQQRALNAIAKSFQPFQQDIYISETRRSSFADDHASPYSARTEKSNATPREPTLTPKELQSTASESMIMLCEIINSSSSKQEVRSNEIGVEFSDKLKKLQPKFAVVIEEALSKGSSNVDELFTLNENIIKVLWVYDHVLDDSVTITEAKQKIRSVQSMISGTYGESSFMSSSTTYTNEYSFPETVSVSSAQNSYSNYQPAALYGNPSTTTTSTSYSSYAPPAMSNGYASSQSSYVAASSYATDNYDRRSSLGSYSSSNSIRLPPAGAPEQIYRAESFYKAPLSTLPPPSRVIPSSTPTPSPGGYTPSSISSLTNITYESSSDYQQQLLQQQQQQQQQALYQAPQIQSSTSQSRYVSSIPLMPDPFQGANLAQPVKSTSKSPYSDSTAPREMFSSNALIENMLQSDSSPSGYRRRSSEHSIVTEDPGLYKFPYTPPDYRGNGTTTVSTNSYSYSSVEGPLQRIPATKLGAASTAPSSNTAITPRGLPPRAFSSYSQGPASSSVVLDSANPFDAFVTES